MFYSQFILAKKGPLGTIWIAAHLERKLRKNQVADTDIGVSVDSILFPDAPIALRLSSHLLLGVVRIYSKKVNYLFNDCSEALIKIKHAFRSTAVDLPPEESTAPYHSITLPENFDLDNFELPDSAFLDGYKYSLLTSAKSIFCSNFVDHHVSAREQITLQDTRNDTAFPTSKFGLDERFGDEDPSQIGLELDEDLFIEKKVSPKHDEDSMSFKVSGSHYGETSVPSSSVAVDVQLGCNEEKYNEIPNELSELLSNNYDKNFLLGTEVLRRDANSSHRHGFTIQTPDLNETIQPEGPMALSPYIPFSPNDVQTPCLVEPAQEPSTPALLEVVPSHFQEVPVLSPQYKDEMRVELGRPGTCTSPSAEVECSDAGNKTIRASAELDHKFGEDAQRLPLPSALISPMPESVTPTYSKRNSTTDNVCLVADAECQQNLLLGSEINNVSTTDHRIDNEEAIEPSAFSHEAMTLTFPPKLAAHFGAEPATTNICTQSVDVSGNIFTVEQTPFNGSTEPTETANLNHVKDGDSFRSTSVVGSDFLIRSCGSNLHLPSSPFVQTAPLEAELATSNIHTDNFDVSGVNLDMKRACMNEPTETFNLGRGEDNDSCVITSVVGSDFLSRSRVSNLHPTNSNFVDGALGEASELSLRDYCFSQKTPPREEVQQISRSSFEVQGEDLRYSNDRFINLEGQHMPGYTPPDFKYGARKPNELSMNVLSKVSHLDNEKYPSSSEFLEPEKMLAPNFGVDFPSYQVPQATDKGSTQSDEFFDRNDSQFSRKRRLMDSTILQTSTSAGLSRSKRSADYIPSDNDVLASILDERTTPWLKTSSIPSLSKVSSQKRPRPMSRVGMPRRRKVLVDDAMVLHAERLLIASNVGAMPEQASKKFVEEDVNFLQSCVGSG
ncbi:Sister chromatid cohesion 1 protein 3 [Platanthera guangdongensis]|uniref:Sister chromatid cohesion 1 protein 3 n=1 Tax=Platanthera guangdongensis TaxID=2320717 RepID=A0ABR2MAK2_9ASPA